MPETDFLAMCTPAAVRIRTGGPSDAADAAGVWLRSRRHAIPAIPAPVHSDDEVRAFFADVVVPRRELYVAENSSGGIVGLMALEGDWIDQFYLEPGWTGHGVGACFIDLAKRLRPGGLDLWTFQSNAGARRFYERLGFVAAEFTDGRHNEERAPDVHLRWPGGG